MTLTFQKATKASARARVALVGPAGSGKTYSALRIARGLAGPDGRVALVDTEHGSASKYADLFDFDALELDTFSPRTYVEAIHAAEQAGYTVLVIDSFSHAWIGKGGALDLKDQATARSRSKDSFGAWREVTPLHNELVEAVIGAKLHVIATMRSKTEYLVGKDPQGRNTIEKVGTAPVQRDGVEYEFDIVGDLTLRNEWAISKTRCPSLHGAVICPPDETTGALILEWLSGDGPAGGGAPTPPPAGFPATAEGLRTEQQAAGADRRRVDPPSGNGATERTGADWLGELKGQGVDDRTVLDTLKASGEYHGITLRGLAHLRGEPLAQAVAILDAKLAQEQAAGEATG